MLPGIALKHRHFKEIKERRPSLGFLEVHTENFFAPAGYAHECLLGLREHYPVSAHSVGLSLGSADGVDQNHLEKIKKFIEIFQPFLVSDHLSWSRMGEKFLADLLPLPLTEETLEIVCANVEKTQEFLGRKILIENPSTYLEFPESDIPEPEFLAEIAKITGCGVLLDVNNIFVSATNHGFSGQEYLEKISCAAVGEIHLAGFTRTEIAGQEILIDDHGSAVHPSVWALYREAVKKIGAKPTLVEWDTDVPELDVLLAEAEKAAEIMEMQYA